MAHGTETWPVGTPQQRSSFAIAADLIGAGLLHPEALITHRFALSQYREALQIAANKGASSAIKVVFDAAILPATASTIPNVNIRPANSLSRMTLTRLPTLKIRSSRPKASHFTQAISDDLTADIDESIFGNARTTQAAQASQVTTPPPGQLDFPTIPGQHASPTTPIEQPTPLVQRPASAPTTWDFIAELSPTQKNEK
jgi:hypothetical protein